MEVGNSLQPSLSNSMTCWVFAKNASIRGHPGRTMQKPCSREREDLETTHFPMHAPGRRSSRRTRHGGGTTISSIIMPIAHARTGGTAPLRCWDIPFQKRCSELPLYATQFTRHLDKHGYIKFQHWKVFR